MSQKTVYVRRAITPRYDPDPDPDPVSLIVIALCAIGVSLAGSTIVSPNLWTNLMIMINPKIAELEKDRLEAQEKMMNTIVIVIGVVAIIVLAYVFWRWNVQKKEAKRNRNYRNRALRTYRR